MRRKMEKKTQTYTTNQICEIAGVTAPRIHQMRNGQKVKIKGKVYKIEPILIQKQHWDWVGTEVTFFPSALDAILNRRKRVPSSKKLVEKPNNQSAPNQNETISQ